MIYTDYVILLEISSSFQQWKNFENRLRFDTVIAKSLVASFFGTQCSLLHTHYQCEAITKQNHQEGPDFMEHGVDIKLSNTYINKRLSHRDAVGAPLQLAFVS